MSTLSRSEIQPANIWHLKNTPLLSGLGDDVLRSVWNSSQIHSFQPGELIPQVDMGEPALWIIKRGHVRINYTDLDGNQVSVILLHPGDLFGAFSETGGETFGESLRTLTSACIARISMRKFESLAQKYPDLAFRMARAGLAQLQRVHLHLAEQMSKPAESRLALALLEVDRVITESIKDDEQCGISHQDLAELIGTSREMVTHILGKFRKKGWIDVKRRRIEIIDREALQMMAED